MSSQPRGVPQARLVQLGGEATTRPIVLIHGFGSDRQGWLANAPALFGLDAVFALELPGHGGASIAVGDGGLSTHVEAARAALADLPGPVDLVGHSLGGAVALALAQAEPVRTGSLALIAPAAVSAPIEPGFPRAFAGLEDEDAARRVLEQLVANPRHLGRGLVPHVLAGLAQPGRRDALAAIAEGLAHHPIDEAQRAFLRDPPMPLLLVWGGRDAICPPDLDLIDAIGPRALLFPEAGHMPHVEVMGRFNQALLGHLRAAREGGGS
ncbi:Pimeloyl-ACP methyl ester carboxylesterase [Devosia enhydra]|uniref:Pimeloyl-ACP methyl ester carboxylesterase n=1 Tax=Devosia enhydra TaxID=665118 RepID=A0A1K2HZT3_9HYPH|nr:alpha/beta fold hydrolase [Devosia enhydra]SFZ85653.1 Pimeloyl-ACP methyl ester carboxylesterase [Devosia enhydra]